MLRVYLNAVAISKKEKKIEKQCSVNFKEQIKLIN